MEVDVIEGKARPTPGKSMISRLIGSTMKSQPVSGVKKASDLHLDEIEVFNTPGHTPGSTSYFLKGEQILFVGDAVVTNSGRPSINRAFTSDYEMAQTSMKKIMEHPSRMILSGHGKPYSKSTEEKVETQSHGQL
jgi:glyoxylase-like metal-dependent hydrolase (beta-lactamase superfamily II)